MTPDESFRAVASDTGRKIDALAERMSADHAEVMAALEALDADGSEADSQATDTETRHTNP